MTYFKVVATNAGGESMQRDVVVAKPQAARRAPILIVNGFDRYDRTLHFVGAPEDLDAVARAALGVGIADIASAFAGQP